MLREQLYEIKRLSEARKSFRISLGSLILLISLILSCEGNADSDDNKNNTINRKVANNTTAILEICNNPRHRMSLVHSSYTISSRDHRIFFARRGCLLDDSQNVQGHYRACGVQARPLYVSQACIAIIQSRHALQDCRSMCILLQ